MIRKIPVLVFFCLLLFTQQAYAVSSFKVIGYVPNWGSWPGIASSVQWSKVTHVHIAFYNPRSTTNPTLTADPIPPAVVGDPGLVSFLNTAHTNNVKAL